jgi:hypothetical protein
VVPTVVELFLEETEKEVVPVLASARLMLGAKHHHHMLPGGVAQQPWKKKGREKGAPTGEGKRRFEPFLTITSK